MWCLTRCGERATVKDGNIGYLPIDDPRVTYRNSCNDTLFGDHRGYCYVQAPSRHASWFRHSPSPRHVGSSGQCFPPLSLLARDINCRCICDSNAGRFFWSLHCAARCKYRNAFGVRRCDFYRMEKCGRDLLPANSIASLPTYMIAKLGLAKRMRNGAELIKKIQINQQRGLAKTRRTRRKPDGF